MSGLAAPLDPGPALSRRPSSAQDSSRLLPLLIAVPPTPSLPSVNFIKSLGLDPTVYILVLHP
ncbi:hypothetical protein K466DRAFT_607692 [Polyporus arcularius HHB13444]|uniref:Uncharacterized protein n=1 Tax=Polyporus arcularius HHB13444 TaxID=1314778 RepID=A0A5C3NKS2_9APHY|nr:hypothetical protein K466DRAFT_607692 [Polyporus arcularius HHB13444]